MLNIYLLYVCTHPILHCQLENTDLGLTVLKACILTQVISSCPALQVLIRLSRHSHALLMILSSCLPYHLRQHSTERHVILSGLETIRDVALCCFLDVFSCHWILIRKLTHNTMKSILYFCDHAMFKKKNHAWYILLINRTLKNGYEKSWWLKIIYLI